MARQVQYSQYGGPEVLDVVEVDTPSAPEGCVVVETRAIGVNPIDSKLRSGARSTSPLTAPRVAGTDAAGVIVEVSADARARSWAEGDEVVIDRAAGAYATHVVASVDQLVRKPAAVGWDAAAGVGVPAGTAYQALTSLGLASGETVLIHAGSGSVGQAAIQLARARGARVVATASPRNHDRLRELGAVPVAYGPGLVDRVREAAPQGIDVVLDAVGNDESLDASVELVSDRSRIGTIVYSARAAEYGIRAWMGGNPKPLTAEEQALRSESFAVVLAAIADGAFDVEIGRRYPLEEAAEAQRASMAHEVRGKIILDPRTAV